MYSFAPVLGRLVLSGCSVRSPSAKETGNKRAVEMRQLYKLCVSEKEMGIQSRGAREGW